MSEFEQSWTTRRPGTFEGGPRWLLCLGLAAAMSAAGAEPAGVRGAARAVRAQPVSQPQPKDPPTAPASPKAPASLAPSMVETGRGFSGVSLEPLDDLRSLILEGPQDQVEALMRVIEEIDRLSAGTEPEIRVVRLRHADAEALALLLTQVYQSRAAARTGPATVGGAVGFTALAQPNAVVIAAQRMDIDEIVRFVGQLDRANATSGAQFRVFRLRQAPALQVQMKLQQFFAQRTDDAGLRMRVEVVADERSNSLIVYAGPSDLEEAERLVSQLDGDQSVAVNEVRVFELRTPGYARYLADLLQQTIVARSQAGSLAAGTAGAGLGGQGLGGQRLGQTAGQGIGGAPGAGPGMSQASAATTGQAGAAATPATAIQSLLGQSVLPSTLGLGAAGGTGTLGVAKVSRLRWVTTGPEGRTVESGILEDITVAADEITNVVIVTGPPSSMGLVAAIIARLDSLPILPSPTTELKVFSLRNADAAAMLETLESVFPSSAGQSYAVGAERGESSLVAPAFSVDRRTNSLIVTAQPNTMLAIEALVLKLETNTARERQTIVYRLRNLTATEAATALEQFLNAQVQAGATTGVGVLGAAAQAGQLSAQQQIRSEVSVVPETISNSLLISSTARFAEEILRIVSEIDMRPPQVVIQVLIAEVALTDDEDLGLEFGAQSSILFDRSLIVQNVANTAETSRFNTRNPGVNFNTVNSLGSTAGIGGRELGLQGLSSFGLGRGGDSGFGGLVLSASSGNVSVLLRALKQQQRLDVLSRPQIMTVDNQQAFIQIGQQVPTITSSSISQFGNTVNTIEYRDVGIILQVTPRISPEGTVLMRVEPVVSSLDRDGIPIATDINGNTVATAPIINTTQAQTTVSAANGETVVLGGLITRDKRTDVRKVPWLGDWPVIGWAFKTRLRTDLKRELLIILTPHVVYDACDLQRIKEMETARIDWILNDVAEVHGDIGLVPETVAEEGTVDAVIPQPIDEPAVPTDVPSMPTAPDRPPQPAPADERTGARGAERGA